MGIVETAQINQYFRTMSLGFSSMFPSFLNCPENIVIRCFPPFLKNYCFLVLYFITEAFRGVFHIYCIYQSLPEDAFTDLRGRKRHRERQRDIGVREEETLTGFLPCMAWLGLEPATFWCTGWRSHWPSHLAGPVMILKHHNCSAFHICSLLNIFLILKVQNNNTVGKRQPTPITVLKNVTGQHLRTSELECVTHKAWGFC